MDLKLKVDGAERERDFYFDKLRDIEILCQTPGLSDIPVRPGRARAGRQGRCARHRDSSTAARACLLGSGSAAAWLSSDPWHPPP